MFNIGLHLLPRPINALIATRIQRTFKTAAFTTKVMAVINQFTYPPVTFEALATSFVGRWQHCGGCGRPRWWKGGSRAGRGKWGRSHKPRILQRKFHNCTEYTKHCINGINKTGHEVRNNKTKTNFVIPYRIGKCKEKSLNTLRFPTNVTIH